MQLFSNFHTLTFPNNVEFTFTVLSSQKMDADLLGFPNKIEESVK